MMGSGGLVVMDDGNCMVDVAKFFMDFIQRESCGKCIPCREGTRRMLEILESLTRSRRQEQQFDALERFRSVMNLEHLAEVIQDTSLCGLGQSAPNPVLSTLRWFREEYEAHVYDRRVRRRRRAASCSSTRSTRRGARAAASASSSARRRRSSARQEPAPHHSRAVRGLRTCVDVCNLDAVLVH